MSKMYAIVRLRGKADQNYNIEHTMKLLRLHKPNHMVVYEGTESLDGMLYKVRDAVTWGEINEETLEYVFRKRGELNGKNVLNDEFLKDNTDFTNIQEFSKAVMSGDAKLKDFPEIQPVFRLSPPRKGFKSLKYPVGKNGDLGYRGAAINELLARMA